MKRTILTSILLLLALAATAQTRSEELQYLHDNPICTYAYNDITHFDVPALTPAPKGYEAFHISHYGRHGSRFAWNSATYTWVRDILVANRDAGNLTELGQKLCEAYIPFCDECLPHTGELTRKGWEQHKEVARRMYKEYPSIFKHNPRIDAASSTSYRAILSMGAFCLSLGECRKNMDIFEQVTPVLFDETIPDAAGNPNRLKNTPKVDRPLLPELQAWRDSTFDWDGVMARLFVDGGKSIDRGFLIELYTAYVGQNSLDKDYNLPDEIFTQEDLLNAYKLECSNIYASTQNEMQYAPLISTLISEVDKAIDTERPTVRLRFGHDYVLQEYLALACVNGFGCRIDDLDDVIVAFPARQIPMCGNVQFVFYRSKKSSDILFKVVLNGEEATLPMLEPVSGPYYRWSEYKDYLTTTVLFSLR